MVKITKKAMFVDLEYRKENKVMVRLNNTIMYFRISSNEYEI